MPAIRHRVATVASLRLRPALCGVDIRLVRKPAPTRARSGISRVAAMAPSRINKKCVLAAHPEMGKHPDERCFRVEQEEVVDKPPEGSILVETLFVSVEPWQRAAINKPYSESGHSMPLGSPIPALGLGRVVASEEAALPVGSIVVGILGVQTLATVSVGMVEAVAPHAEPADFQPESATSLLHCLGAKGITGRTAFFGVRDIGGVAEGETWVVSSASGGVGSVAGQVARLLGAGRVVGIAGGPQKCRYVVERLGFDACVDYRAEDFEKQLQEAVPGGVDKYFEMVGGEVLDATLRLINSGATVVLCGGISQYANFENVKGPSEYLKVAEKNASMKGFTVDRFIPQYGESDGQVQQWLDEGKLKTDYTVVDTGVSGFGDALNMLLTPGAAPQPGKLILKCS